MSMVDCCEIARSIGMDRNEIDFVLWYLHCCTGTLMYYPDIHDDNDWFENHIICSPQVVFDSISQLIVASLRVLHSKGSFTEYERMEMIQKGQFSLQSIEKYCSSYHVKKNFKKNELIPAQQLINLLKHVNLLSPIFHKEADCRERITYLMPAVLECASLNELAAPPSPDDNNPEPSFITFKCGYVPTGSFCGLITRLVTLGPNEILGLTWELVEDGVKRNFVCFTVDGAHTVTLICHNRSYEIRVTRSDLYITLHDLCTHVLSVLLYTLHTLYENLVPQVAFDCPCSVVSSERTTGHLCVLVPKSRIRFICEHSKKCVSFQPKEWLGKVRILLMILLVKFYPENLKFLQHVLPGENANLKVLEYAKLDNFSFCWTKEGSRDQIKTTCSPNILSFQSVSEEDIGYYWCEVKEAGKVVLTVYRALYSQEPNSGGMEPSPSGRYLFGRVIPS